MSTPEVKDFSQQLVMRFHEPVNTAEYYRDRGMRRAVDHAEKITENWSVRAYDFLRQYIARHQEFMTEDVREASRGIVPEPPSHRAWGAIIVRAVKEGLIRRVGFQSVKNTRAHCTPASLWQVI